MSLLAAYGAMLILFLGLDALWLRLAMKPFFERRVGALLAPRPRLGVAAGFYLLYVAGILYFAAAPALREAAWSAALLKGALFGFFAYGTYEATNLATLKGWRWSLLAVDLAWGTALTAAAALAGFLAGRCFG